MCKSGNIYIMGRNLPQFLVFGPWKLFVPVEQFTSEISLVTGFFFNNQCQTEVCNATCRLSPEKVT